MNYTTVTVPIWANVDHTMIDCLVSFTGLGEVPFTASPSDTTAYGKEIYARCVAEDFGPVAEFNPPV